MSNIQWVNNHTVILFLYISRRTCRPVQELFSIVYVVLNCRGRISPLIGLHEMGSSLGRARLSVLLAYCQTAGWNETGKSRTTTTYYNANHPQSSPTSANLHCSWSVWCFESLRPSALNFIYVELDLLVSIVYRS